MGLAAILYRREVASLCIRSNRTEAIPTLVAERYVQVDLTVEARTPRGEPVAATGAVTVRGVVLLETGAFLGAVRRPVVLGCGLFTVVRSAVFDPADTFAAVFFGAIRVLLGVADLAGAALTRFGLLADAGFAATRFAVGPFRAGEDLDEIVEGGLRRALATAVGRFWAFGVTPSACCRAQRARCAAAILAFPSGLIVRRLGGLNSPRLEFVALFLEPLGRPRLGAVSGVRSLGTATAVSSPPSKLRTCVRREISSSIAERISFVFIPTEYGNEERRGRNL